jgi:hypothetical protein
MPEDYVVESYPSAVIQAEKAAPPGTPASTCVVCKGRLFCGMQHCPVLSSVQATYRDLQPCGDETEALALDVTLGADTFPHGPMGLSIGERSLDGVADRTQAFGIIGRWYYAFGGTGKSVAHVLQELALSDRPTAVEVSWSEPPRGTIQFSASEPPRGREGTVSSIELLEDAHVPREVPPLLGGEQSAEHAILDGYEKGLSPEYLARLHALGMFGSPPWQMPTRWALSTVYNACSRRAIQQCKEYDIIGEPRLYASDGMGDRIAVLLLPRPWEFELVEVWQPDTLWTLGERCPVVVNEHETYRGVSDQALREGGSYFSSRMGVADILLKEHMQAAALVLRAPQPQGSVPLGSAVLARCIRDARPSGTFGTEDEAVRAACEAIGVQTDLVLRQSMTMQQDTLSRWF